MSELLELLKNGDTIYSDAFPSRINFFIIKDNNPRYITDEVSDILGYKDRFIIRCWNTPLLVVEKLSAELGLNLESKILYHPEFQGV